MNEVGGSAELTRRRFLHRLGAVVLVQQGAGADSLAGRGDRGTLRDPSAAGRPREPTAAGDSDAEIQAVEQRLACTCGCTLDIFTCRTTDFTCTYSPELHREVVALHQAGKSGQEIVDAFVAKYGEEALMAPKPEGFNLAGYLLPGAAIAVAGAALLAVISRRRVAVAAAGGAPAGGPASDAAPRGAAPVPPPSAASATPEELERLKRALSEVED